MAKPLKSINYYDIPRRVNKGTMNVADAKTILMESPYELKWDHEQGKYTIEYKDKYKP